MDLSRVSLTAELIHQKQQASGGLFRLPTNKADPWFEPPQMQSDSYDSAG